MAKITNTTVQYRYMGNGFIDSKLDPYNTLADLKKAYPSKFRKDGLFGIVLNTDKPEKERFPQIYILQGIEWKPLEDRVVTEQILKLSNDVNSHSTDLTDVKAKLEEIQKGLSSKAEQAQVDRIEASLSDQIKLIAGKANQSDLESLSERVNKIRGIDKLKPGTGIAFAEDIDGTITINANIPDVDELNNRIDLMGDNIAKMAGDINDINGNITSIKGDITKLTQKDSEIEGKLASLAEKDKSIDSEISKLKEKDASIEGTVNSFDQRITDAESKASSAESKVNGFEGRMTSVEGTVRELDTKVNGFDGRIKTVEGSIETINATDKKQDNDIKNLNDKIAGIETGGGIEISGDDVD